MGTGAVITSACSGDLDEPSDEATPDGPAPPTVVEPLEVPTNPPEIVSEGACVAIAEDQTLMSVSPEGHAWLVTSGVPSSTIRIVDPFDLSHQDEEVELENIEVVHALSGVDAAVVAGGELWRLEDLARISLTAPDGFVAPAALCGDLSTNGFVLSSASLFERRADEWWGWSSGESGDAAPSALITREGECSGSDNAVWSTSVEGVLWKVDPAEVSQPTRFDRFQTAVARESGLVVLADETMYVAPEPWQPWVFTEAPPEAISAAGDAVWVVSGSKLLKLEDDQWSSVTFDLEGPVRAMAAHPGGVWLVGDDQLCHQSIGPMVRVLGLRPYQRTTEASFEVLLQSNQSEAMLAMRLNGEAVELEDAVEPEGWYRAIGSLDKVGWHQFEAQAGASVRSLPVKLIPLVDRSWAEDIAPIFEQSCSGSTCHSGEQVGNAPALASYGAWVENAAKIRIRVVDEATMPPPDAVGPEWDEDDIVIISEWLEGGMLP